MTAPAFRLLPPPPPAPPTRAQRRRALLAEAESTAELLRLAATGVDGKSAGAMWPEMYGEAMELLVAQLRKDGSYADPEAAATRLFAVVMAPFHGARVKHPTLGMLNRVAQSARVWAMFDGRNATELAAKLGLSVRGVYKILSRYREERKAAILARYGAKTST